MVDEHRVDEEHQHGSGCGVKALVILTAKQLLLCSGEKANVLISNLLSTSMVNNDVDDVDDVDDVL